MPNYYSPPPEKRVPLNIRVPGSLKDRLNAIVKLWRVIAEANGHDPDSIDLTFVCERLLQIGDDGVWAQAGRGAGLDGMPRDDEEWDRLVKAIYKDAKPPRTK